MPAFNKVIIAGHLTRDPETRNTQSGATVCAFGVAINERYRGKDGTPQDKTVFVDVTAWNKTADLIAKYLRKGSAVLVEGALSLDQWDAQDGTRRSKTYVTAQTVKFLSAPAGDQAGRKQSDDRGRASDEESDSADNLPF